MHFTHAVSFNLCVLRKGKNGVWIIFKESSLECGIGIEKAEVNKRSQFPFNRNTYNKHTIPSSVSVMIIISNFKTDPQRQPLMEMDSLLSLSVDIYTQQNSKKKGTEKREEREAKKEWWELSPLFIRRAASLSGSSFIGDNYRWKAEQHYIINHQRKKNHSYASFSTIMWYLNFLILRYFIRHGLLG